MMDPIAREVVKRKFCLITENLYTEVIRQYLFQEGIVNDKLYLEKDKVRTRRAETFMEMAVEKCTFKTLLEIFSKNGYDFIADELQTEFDKLKTEMNATHHIPKDRKEPIFDVPWRAKTLQFRHKLKRLGHSGDMKTFEKERNIIEKQWELKRMSFDFSDESREVADMYFMTLDAELERLRVINDKDLRKSVVLCDKMAVISAYTSSGTIPIAMYLARFGSANLVAGTKTIRQALKYIADAKQKLSTVPACREKGVVHYIEYNMLTQLYESEQDLPMREQILHLGEETIGHFESEVTDKAMGKDFRRMVLLKMCHMLLDIGLFHNFLEGKCVTEENIRKAEGILKEIEKPDTWCRMENRWFMFYFTAKSRLCLLRKCSKEALKYLLESAKYAERCKCKKELHNIKMEIRCMQTGNKNVISMYSVYSEIFSRGLGLLLFLILLLLVTITIVLISERRLTNIL